MAKKREAMTVLASILSSKSSLKRLSTSSGVAQNRLQELADGAEPSLREIRLVAHGLGIPMTDLVPSANAGNTAGALFRSADPARSAKSWPLISRMSQRIGYALDILGDRPKFWWKSEFDVATISAETAEANAVAYRRLFLDDDQFSPLLNLPRIVVEKMNVLLFVIKSAELDGASITVEDQPFIFISERFNARMLFTLAHEVGHIVAAANAEHGFAVLDASREHTSGKGKNAGELFAHRFASALLLPRPGLVSALARIREVSGTTSETVGDIDVLLIARFFGVSFAVAGHRFEQLGFLPRGATSEIEKELKLSY